MLYLDTHSRLAFAGRILEPEICRVTNKRANHHILADVETSFLCELRLKCNFTSYGVANQASRMVVEKASERER